MTLHLSKRYDLLVVGGGIVGLWIAKRAAEAGLDIALIERSSCGGAASGTPLGALMPHLPGPLDEKKSFQLAALLSLGSAVGALESQTGAPCGYRRL
ncbi:MAG: FAD-dependent oxidoreductase, partial [Pseudomonadota bacterium]